MAKVPKSSPTPPQNTIKIEVTSQEPGANTQEASLAVEQAVLGVTSQSQKYIPKTANRSVVTLENTEQLFHQIKLNKIQNSEQLEDAITPKKKDTTTKVLLTESALDNSITTKNLSELHRALIEAVLSQLVAGNSVFTASMLYRTMTGKSTNVFVHREQQAMIDELMRDLMYTPLSIDLHLSDRSKDSPQASGVLESAIIPAERLQIDINGISCSAYQITKYPPLLRFCVLTDNIAMTPMDFLALEMNYTSKNLVILNILQRRLAPLLYPTNGRYEKPAPLLIPYDIFYDAVMDTAVEQANVNQFKVRVRNTIHSILDSWTTRKYIEAWEPVKNRNRYTGFKVFFPNRPPVLPENNMAELK